MHCKYIQWSYSGNWTHVKSVHFTSIWFAMYSPMFRKAKLRQPTGQTLSNVRTQRHLLPLRTIYFRSYQYETHCRRNGFETHVKSVKTTMNTFAVWLKTTFGPLHLFKLWAVGWWVTWFISSWEEKNCYHSVYIPCACHYNPLLIWNRSQL